MAVPSGPAELDLDPGPVVDRVDPLSVWILFEFPAKHRPDLILGATLVGPAESVEHLLILATYVVAEIIEHGA